MWSNEIKKATWKNIIEYYNYVSEQIIFDDDIAQKICFGDGSYALVIDNGEKYIAMGDENFSGNTPIGIAGQYQSVTKDGFIVNPSVSDINFISKNIFHEDLDLVAWKFADDSILVYRKDKNIFVSMTENSFSAFIGE